jgi:hypothetical protein
VAIPFGGIPVALLEGCKRGAMDKSRADSLEESGSEPEPPLGRANIRTAWWMIAASMAVGAVLGLWSFGGPVAPPAGFRAFDDLPRRLVRLGHIAAIALPALNLLYVPWMARSRWGGAARRAGCRLLLFGTVVLPSLLMLTAFWSSGLYLLPVPVAALIGAVWLLAAGLPGRTADPEEGTVQ